MTTPRLDRLRAFIGDLGALVAGESEEEALLRAGAALLGDLVAQDDWLPEAFARPHPERYRQYLLHCDSRERFSVVSFVWGPGQSTPIHDHRVWGLVGVLRGAEIAQSYGWVRSGLGALGAPHRLARGDVEAISPLLGDVHQVRNAFADQTSVSIHVYGANIGAVTRAVYALEGTEKPFVSGYDNEVVPNVWGARP